MKNLIYGIIVIGLISAIAGIFLVFSERNKAIMDKNMAEYQRDDAFKARRSAEDDKNTALKAKEESEKQVQIHKVQTEQALKDTAEANNKSKGALEEKDKALNAKKEADDQRDQALSSKTLAEDARREAERKQQEAEARSEAEIADRQIVVRNLEKEIKSRESTEADYRKVVAVEKEADNIARFCASIISTVFISFDSGDKHYINACDSWRDAKDQKQKMVAMQFFTKAKDNYNTVLTNIAKLENLNKDTEQIKAYIKSAVEDSISSADIMIALLKKILQEKDIPFTEIDIKSKLAAKKKHEADNTIVEACTLILGTMDNYKNAFSPSQRGRVETLKKEIEKRIKPEASDESALSN